MIGAGTDEHFAVGANLLERVAAQDLDTDRAFPVEQHACGERIREHVDVAACHGRVQIGHGRAATPAGALRELKAAHAVLRGAVVILVRLDAGFDRRLDAGIDERVHRAAVADRERPSDTVVIARATLVVLGSLEVREHVLVAPTLETQRRPLVVVEPVAADVDHRVERARAAEHPPAREVRPAAVETGLGLALEIPVDPALEQEPERHRDLDLGIAVGLDRPR